MPRFKWIDWNLAKIAAHSLSADEVEEAFEQAIWIRRRRDDSYEMLGKTRSGKVIQVIWRYDRDDDEMASVDDPVGPAIFVITAY